MTRRPTVGLLGIPGAQSDPELAEHHQGYLSHVGRRLATVADIVSGVPAASDEQLADVIAELGRIGVDGCVLVALGDRADGDRAPDRRAEVLARLEAPLLLANIQPERAVGDDWSEYDQRFNAGIATAQRLAGGLVALGARFAALTGDWLSDRFVAAFEDWARAAQTLAVLAQTAEHDLLAPAAATLLDESTTCRMRAMDFNRNALLLAAAPGFTGGSGPLTTAALAHLEAGGRRLVVGSGALLRAATQPLVGSAHLLFAPDAGMEAFMDAWLQLGASTELVIATGERRDRWRRLAEMLEIECEEIR